MSALIGHIKAMRALADSFAVEISQTRFEHVRDICCSMTIVYNRAAATLEDQMRQECSGSLAEIIEPET